MEWNIKSVERWKKKKFSTRIYQSFQIRKHFKKLFKTNQRTGLTIIFFGQGFIKANLSDKQSSNPHDYFQKG